MQNDDASRKFRQCILDKMATRVCTSTTGSIVQAENENSTADVVLVGEGPIPRGQWPLGGVTDANVDRDGHVKMVGLVTKLCLLERSD